MASTTTQMDLCYSLRGMADRYERRALELREQASRLEEDFHLGINRGAPLEGGPTSSNGDAPRGRALTEAVLSACAGWVGAEAVSLRLGISPADAAAVCSRLKGDGRLEARHVQGSCTEYRRTAT